MTIPSADEDAWDEGLKPRSTRYTPIFPMIFGLSSEPKVLVIMWRHLEYLMLLLPNLSLSIAISPPATDPQMQQINLPTGPSNLPSNISDAPVQFANTTMYGGRPIGCFAQRKPPLPPLPTISPMDCYTNMARALLLGDDVMDRRIWTRYNVPFSYSARSCLIILDSEDMTVVDHFSEAEIAHLAAVITFPCVENNDVPLGGRTHIGDKGEFTVTVFGRRPPPE
ncbi:MAG: hypothetical protein Q9166_006771 [cf. Caloplaca sp. 2 TL-2023]